MDTSFFISEDPEEIAKEQQKQKKLCALLPGIMGDNGDETEYVLLGDRTKKEKEENSSPIMIAKTNKETIFEQKNTGFDPWEHEKRLDRMRTITYPGMFGKVDTMELSRPNYRSQEDFDSISRHKFESVMPYSFIHEGGYSNHKHDRGGETNWGITRIFMLDNVHALPGGVPKEIKDLTKEDAKALYKAQWDKFKLGYIRDKRLAYVLNDYMINSNAYKVVKRLKGILNRRGANLKVNTTMDGKTLETIHKTDTDWLIKQILIDRYENYLGQIEDPTQNDFRNGWFKRLKEVAEKVGFDIQF